jgi:hypothetical protein
MLCLTPGKPLSQCTDEELVRIMVYCCIMVGIDKPPSEDKKQALLIFLRNYHGTLTTEQAKQAFELYASGGLQGITQEHYNTVSPLYISTVLRTYSAKLAGLLREYRDKKRRRDEDMRFAAPCPPKGGISGGETQRTAKAVKVGEVMGG